MAQVWTFGKLPGTFVVPNCVIFSLCGAATYNIKISKNDWNFFHVSSIRPTTLHYTRIKTITLQHTGRLQGQKRNVSSWKKYFWTPLLEDLTRVRNIVQKKPNCTLTLMRYITDDTLCHMRLKIPGTGVKCIVDIWRHELSLIWKAWNIFAIELCKIERISSLNQPWRS